MIRSMTGYGEASGEFERVHYFVELRSLNNKYLKTTIKLPEEFQGLEAELESALRRRLHRGTIVLRGSFTDVSESAACAINHRALERYIEQLSHAKPIAQGKLSVDVGSLLALPGVLQPPGNEEGRLAAARHAFTTLLERACDGLIEMRRTEGDQLVRDLREHRDEIATRLERISERAPEVVRVYEQRLRSRIEALLQDASLAVEPVEIVREIAAYAEKTDIAEELSRLRGHIDQFGDLLDSTDDRPIGRTLDFLAQEMLREANTITSKSPDADISRWIVEVKGTIDRIKEQAQNVE